MNKRFLLTLSLFASVSGILALAACVDDFRQLTLTVTNSTNERLCSESGYMTIRPCPEDGGCLSANDRDWEDFDLSQECIDPGEKWTVVATFTEEPELIGLIEIKDSFLKWPDVECPVSVCSPGNPGPRVTVGGEFSPPRYNNNGNDEPDWYGVDNELVRDKEITTEALGRALEYGLCRINWMNDGDQVCPSGLMGPT